MTLNRGVVTMCAAQACAQIGAFSVAALLPTLIAVWSLSNTEAGRISGIYYAAYTLAVPLLASVTDRVDPKRVYLASVALTAIAFAGFAWIGTGFWSALAGNRPEHRDFPADARLASDIHAAAGGERGKGARPHGNRSWTAVAGGRGPSLQASIACTSSALRLSPNSRKIASAPPSLSRA
jgi:Major Facilitator Superfamily